MRLLAKLKLDPIKRTTMVQGAFFFAFAIIAVRATTMHLFPPSSQSLSGLAIRQYQQSIQLSPYRGTIFDRRNNPLAISNKKSSLYVNPRVFNPTPNQTSQLSRLLRIPTSKIVRISSKKSYFSWLSRGISDGVRDKVLALEVDGIQTVTEPARFYPYNHTFSQIIGITGIDNRGLMGLEKQYETYLKGESSKIIRTRDAKGQTFYRDSSLANPEVPGHNLHLTIDVAIQEIVEQALAKGVKAANAKSGGVIVQDPHTGRLLALASFPTFNPNVRASITPQNMRSIPLVDVYEPGSVLKPLIIAEALERGIFKESDLIDCEESGVYYGSKWKIHDTHANGIINLKEILIHSSNIGTYKISEALGKKSVFDLYKRIGIGSDELKLPFVGQAVGQVHDFKGWIPVQFANISFGQGLLTTGIEIAAFYSAIANGGILLKPSIVHYIKSDEGDIIKEFTSINLARIFSKDTTINFLKSALFEVVESGTGSNAKLDRYTVAGKTGTAEKVDPKTNRYSKSLRSASFVGFTPVKDPHLTIYVLIDEPANKPYYGGTWAAPVFREIAERSLNYLNVAPDRSEPSHVTNAKGVLHDSATF